MQLFCMKLCHSHAVFVRAYERANLESFLDGHVRAFEFFGGVPKRIAYDNLKSAVVYVGRGRERRLNRRFLELRSWYLFDSRFCNVAKGNEKGHVENLVKRSQRTFLTPLPEVQDLDELNAKLAAGLPGGTGPDGSRGPAATGRCGRRRSPACLPLPAEAFPACQERSSIVDKQSLVQFDEHLYSVPVRWAHHPYVLKGFVDRVEISCEHERGGGASAELRPGAVRAGAAALSAAVGAKTGAVGPGPAVPGQPVGRGLRLVASGVGVPLGRRGNAAVHPRPAVDDGASGRGGASGGGRLRAAAGVQRRGGGGGDAERAAAGARCGGWTWRIGPSWPAWARASGRRACTINWRRQDEEVAA